MSFCVESHSTSGLGSLEDTLVMIFCAVENVYTAMTAKILNPTEKRLAKNSAPPSKKVAMVRTVPADKDRKNQHLYLILIGFISMKKKYQYIIVCSHLLFTNPEISFVHTRLG